MKTTAKTIEAPKALTKKQTEDITRWWKESIVKALREELDASLKLLTKIIELVPTSAAAHYSRSNVRARLRDKRGQAADLKRSKELAKLAEEHGWPTDIIVILKTPPPEVEQAAFNPHTTTTKATMYWSDVTADDSKAAGLAVRKGVTGKLRIVAGARYHETGFEAVAFGEVKVGRTWSAATKTLTGKPASAAIEKLHEANRRYNDLWDVFDEVLDGFEEQEGLQADFD